jgi:hypothetical protein
MIIKTEIVVNNYDNLRLNNTVDNTWRSLSSWPKYAGLLKACPVTRTFDNARTTP